MPPCRSSLTTAVVAVSAALFVPLSSNAQTAKATTPSLRIVVIAGEDSVNVVQQRTAVAPIVEVRDQNDQPVAGAVVRFAVRGKAAFVGGANTASTTTNAVGQATVSQFTATGTGAVRIEVVATAQGQSVSATITQTNYATAAQAANANPSSGGGGGGLGAGKIIAITTAAAAAGGYVVYDKVVNQPMQPAFGCNLGGSACEAFFNANPSQGVAGVTTIFISYGGTTWGIGRTTFSVDWGDGDKWSGNPDDLQNTHVYRSAGTFTIRMTITDKSGLSDFREATVTIRSLTGSWLSEGGTLNLSQDRLQLNGMFLPRSGAAPVSVSGRLSEGTDLQFSLHAGSSTFTGRALTSDVLSGNFSDGRPQTFRRQ